MPRDSPDYHGILAALVLAITHEPKPPRQTSNFDALARFGFVDARIATAGAPPLNFG